MANSQQLTSDRNFDAATVDHFGREWSTFDQRRLHGPEYESLFASYFAIFPWQKLPPDAEGMDVGCGSGRWALSVAHRVGRLHCIDASDGALAVARKTLARSPNCSFHCAPVDRIPLADNSLDFGYSLGVLHHVPDTLEGLRACVRKLKPGAPFLVYLYYALDNRPTWFRLIWQTTDLGRKLISRLPWILKLATTQLIAAFVYYPLARTAALLERTGKNVERFPLAGYRNRSFYTMRTDALDRFGTPVEKRFTQSEIRSLMLDAGLTDVRVNPDAPYWCAVGFKP